MTAAPEKVSGGSRQTGLRGGLGRRTVRACMCVWKKERRAAEERERGERNARYLWDSQNSTGHAGVTTGGVSQSPVSWLGGLSQTPENAHGAVHISETLVLAVARTQQCSSTVQRGWERCLA